MSSCWLDQGKKVLPVSQTHLRMENPEYQHRVERREGDDQHGVDMFPHTVHDFPAIQAT